MSTPADVDRAALSRAIAKLLVFNGFVDRLTGAEIHRLCDATADTIVGQVDGPAADFIPKGTPLAVLPTGAALVDTVDQHAFEMFRAGWQAARARLSGHEMDHIDHVELEQIKYQFPAEPTPAEFYLAVPDAAARCGTSTTEPERTPGA